MFQSTAGLFFRLTPQPAVKGRADGFSTKGWRSKNKDV